MEAADFQAIEEAIDELWTFWAGKKDGYGTAINEHSPTVTGEIADEVGKRISAIHPDLQWETGPGKKSDHHIAITAAGNLGLRLLAERVLASAPESCKLWEYYSSRQRSTNIPDLTIEFDDGVKAKLDEFTFVVTLDENWSEVDIIAYHPVFQTIDANRAHTLLFLFLDNLLGEDDVTSWLGSIEVTNEVSDQAISGQALRDMVDELKSEATEDRFSLIEINPDGGEQPFVALWNPSLKRLDHMWLDHHVEIHLPLLSPEDNGLPAGEENKRLGEIEDALVESLGPDTIYFGHVTGRGMRSIRLHTTQESSLFKSLDGWIASHPEYQIEVAVTLDPGWAAHRDILGLLWQEEEGEGEPTE